MSGSKYRRSWRVSSASFNNLKRILPGMRSGSHGTARRSIVSTETETLAAACLRDNQIFMQESRCHPEIITMKNEFHVSTSTWLTFFGVGFLIGLLFFRRRRSHVAGQYRGPVPPIIPRAVPAPPLLPRAGGQTAVPVHYWN
jgi:LPXTG-motif cell wall-anchored protein